MDLRPYTVELILAPRLWTHFYFSHFTLVLFYHILYVLQHRIKTVFLGRLVFIFLYTFFLVEEGVAVLSEGLGL